MTGANRIAQAQPLTATQAARADQVIAALARLWPKCFAVYQRRRRPLMIGIDRVVIALMKPAIAARRISEVDIRRALRWYTNSEGYLARCVIAGTERIALDGAPAGPAVSERPAARAQRLMAQRREKAQQRNGAEASASAVHKSKLCILKNGRSAADAAATD
jgi:sRNA-binding protein